MFERDGYIAHERTYRGFLEAVIWSAVLLAMAMVALYFLAIANLPWAGWLILAVILPLTLILKATGSLRR